MGKFEGFISLKKVIFESKEGEAFLRLLEQQFSLAVTDAAVVELDLADADNIDAIMLEIKPAYEVEGQTVTKAKDEHGRMRLLGSEVETLASASQKFPPWPLQ